MGNRNSYDMQIDDRTGGGDTLMIGDHPMLISKKFNCSNNGGIQLFGNSINITNASRVGTSLRNKFQISHSNNNNSTKFISLKEKVRYSVLLYVVLSNVAMQL